MAPKGTEMAVVAVLVVMLWGGASAQSGCTSALMGLAPCLNFVSGNSSSPSSSCCSQLANVVQAQPRCLCSLLNGAGPSTLGITINQTLALSLPGACSVQTPPVSQCNAAANGPTTSASSPASSPSNSPVEPSELKPEAPAPSKPSVPDVPSSSGSKSVPAKPGPTSDGNNTRAPLPLLVFVVFIMSCASTATKF